MREACSLVWSALVGLFRSRASLVAEILVLRHQLNIQRRHLPKRQTFSAMDRLGTRALSLEKDAPFSRTVELAGHILCRLVLGGLHHQYVRI
jgi:hypothetical protein